MHLAKRATRLVTVMAAAAAIALTIGASTAGAAVAAPAGTPHSTTAHHATAATTAKPKAQQIAAAPGGCNNGNLCVYNAGNGGNLCFQWNKNGDWKLACKDTNEGEYNRNGNAVTLQGNPSGRYCTYFLYSGHYLLYNSKDHFQSNGCTGYTLEHHLYANEFV